MQALSKIQPPFALPAGGGRSRLAPPSSTSYTIKSGATGAGNEGWNHVQQGQQPSLKPGMEYGTFVNQQAGSSSSSSRAVATGRVPDSTSRTIRSSSSSTSSQSSSPPFSRDPSTNSTPMSSKAPTPNSSTRALELSMAPFDTKPTALPYSGQQQDSIEEEWEVIYPDD